MYKIIRPFIKITANNPIRKFSSNNSKLNKHIYEELININKNLEIISININLLSIITTVSSTVYLIRGIFNV
jgi:hypothetical protein